MHQSTSIKNFALFLTFSMISSTLAHSPISPANHRRQLDKRAGIDGRLGEALLAARAGTTTTTTDIGGGLLGALVNGLDPTTSTAVSSIISPTDVTSSTRSSISTTTSSTAEITSQPVAVSPSSGVASFVTGLSTNTTGSKTSSVNASTIALNSTSSTSTSSSVSTSATLAPATSIYTDAQGQTSIVTLVYTQSIAPTTTISNSTALGDGNSTNTTSAVSTPAIIGIAVGVGAVLFTLIGCAIWRMKRRGSNGDEAIRWPELNRHGDSDAQHALPARQTGQHGFETNPLQRSLSIASSFQSNSLGVPVTAVPMALNGSSFGAASSVEDYDEKDPHYLHQDEYDESIHHLPISGSGSPPVHHPMNDEYDEAYAMTDGYNGHRVGEQVDPRTGYEFEDYTSFPPPVGQAMSHVPGDGRPNYPAMY